VIFSSRKNKKCFNDVVVEKKEVVMKKVFSAVLVCSFVFLLSSFVFAQDSPQNDKPQGSVEIKPEGMPGPAAMMMEHGKKMMGMMGGKSMVATSDGGVVILIGNKLQKYDKNLLLQKEVEIKMDKDMMSKKMKCPKMAEKEGMGEKKEGTPVESHGSMEMPAPDKQ